MLQALSKWYRVRKHRLTQYFVKSWKQTPTKQKELLIYYGNYVLNGTLISIAILIFLYFHNPWVRFLGIVPMITITLIFLEHYYKWFRIDYKNE